MGRVLYINKLYCKENVDSYQSQVAIGIILALRNMFQICFDSVNNLSGNDESTKCKLLKELKNGTFNPVVTFFVTCNAELDIFHCILHVTI